MTRPSTRWPRPDTSPEEHYENLLKHSSTQPAQLATRVRDRYANSPFRKIGSGNTAMTRTRSPALQSMAVACESALATLELVANITVKSRAMTLN